MQRIAVVNGIERYSLFFVSRNSVAGCRYETALAVFLLVVRRLYQDAKASSLKHR
jgi:hypothetical protein